MKKSNHTQDEGIRAAIYLRVSTDEQKQSGLGIDAQKERCIKALELRDWIFSGEYLDDGISGAKDEEKRPALKRLMEDCKAKKLDAVISLDLSRLGRRTVLILSLVDRFAAMGIQIVSCKENIDTSTAMGKAMLGFVAVFAQVERDLASERTRAALDEAGKRTGYKGGAIPYGFRRTGEFIDVIEDEAEAVRSIFQWRNEGATLRQIATWISDHYKAPKGNTWYHASIAVILGNEDAYKGGRRHDSAYFWPAILKA